jgi:hypothetical protein
MIPGATGCPTAKASITHLSKPYSFANSADTPAFPFGFFQGHRISLGWTAGGIQGRYR